MCGCAYVRLGTGGVAGNPVGDLPGWTYAPAAVLDHLDVWPQSLPLLALTVGGLDRDGRRQRRVIVAAVPTWLDVALCALNAGLQWAETSACVEACARLEALFPWWHAVYTVGGYAALDAAVCSLARDREEV